MRRGRTPALIIAVVLTAALAGCSEESPRWRGVDGPSSPVASAPDRVTPPSSAPTGSAPVEPFAVGVRELALKRDGDRVLPVTIWYPATGSVGGAPRPGRPAARGRFPVVVFSHGLTARPADYTALLTRWAAAGFVVAAPTFPGTSRGAARYDILDVLNQPADVSFALTRVLALDGRAGDPLQGRLATDRVAATGHSAGGVTTVGLFTIERDDRLDAGIVLAGSALGVGTAFVGTDAPQLFVHGERDEVVSYSAGRAAYEAVPWPKAMLSLPDGDHGRSLLQGADRSFAVVADTTVEFLRWSLYGDAAAKRRLPGDAVRGGLATLDNRL